MTIYESSEAVARGHPDKVADFISDSVLDSCLQEDPMSRVAVETLVSHRTISIGGEITTRAHLNFEQIVRDAISEVGYVSPTFGDLLSSFQLVSSICEQSPDISQSVGKGHELAAGDQGMMYGYACDDTTTFMPRSYEMARGILQAIQTKRSSHPFLGPDGKVQVSINPERKNHFSGSVVVSWQHSASASLTDVQEVLHSCVEEVGERFKFKPDLLLLNPSGRFVLGGPFADTGLTGRKQIVDSYGGSVLHGGGAYSGKDATKVDRSGAYMARWVAKHVVASGAAKRCQVQLIFSIGKKDPIHVGIDCFHTEKTPLEKIEKAILATFDFSVEGIIRDLDLRQPIFKKTSSMGHFGREGFTWESLSRLDSLRSSFEKN